MSPILLFPVLQVSEIKRSRAYFELSWSESAAAKTLLSTETIVVKMEITTSS